MNAYRDPARELDIAIAPDRRRRNRLLAFAGGIGATLAVAFLGSATRDWLSPTRPWPRVDELFTTGRRDVPRRVNGDLVPGSMVRLDGPCEYRFAVESAGFRMPVRYASCVLSDPLAEALEDHDPVPITIEGTLGPGGFVATAVLTRTPSCCFCSPEARKEQRRAAREARLRDDP